MATLKWLVLLLVCCACARSPQMPAAYGASALVPPTRYWEHWQKMQQCTGRYKSFRDVKWYVAFDDLRGTHGQWVGGLAFPTEKWIVMRAAFIDVDYLVQHEIVHLLMPEVKNHEPPFGTCTPEFAF